MADGKLETGDIHERSEVEVSGLEGYCSLVDYLYLEVVPSRHVFPCINTGHTSASLPCTRLMRYCLPGRFG